MQLEELEEPLQWLSAGWLDLEVDYLTPNFATNGELSSLIENHNEELEKSGEKILLSPEDAVKDKSVAVYRSYLEEEDTIFLHQAYRKVKKRQFRDTEDYFDVEEEDNLFDF